MASFPASIARVPNLLLSQLQLSNIQRTSTDLFRVQTELSTGRSINRPSDDIVRAAAISILDERLERASQRMSNLDTASRQLDLIDQALGEANDLILEAKNIASEQSNFGTSAEERASQAVVIDSLIRQLFNLVNRDSVSGNLFAGSTPGRTALESLGGGYLFNAEGDRLLTDLGAADTVPVTLGGDSTIGGLVTRYEGLVEIVPELDADTRLADLLGARRLGVQTGEALLSINGGANLRIDLRRADTAGDVADRIERAIRDAEAESGTTVLGAGGVSLDADGFVFDLAPGATLRFADTLGSFTARDLGLAGEPAFDLTDAAGQGAGVEPKLTLLSAIPNLGGPLGSIRVTNAGRTAVVDLSQAQTVQDIRNALLDTGLGVDLEIDPTGRRLVLVNEFSGPSDRALSVEEIPGSNATAARLGIRTLDLTTPIDRFNGGVGVRPVPETPDPITGLPNPIYSRDFTVTLGNGFSFSVDLREGDLLSVDTLLSAVNTQADAALTGAGLPTNLFTAGLDADGANGLVFTQAPGLGGPLTVARENNSLAFADLGLHEALYDPTTGTLRTSDPAKVRVENVFTYLLDLKDALERNDTLGISLAGTGLEGEVDRVAQARALVGGHARQLESATRLQEDRIVLDEATRSQLRDTDFAEAATRFSLLQTQLSASLQVTAQQNSLTLLDFLG